MCGDTSGARNTRRHTDLHVEVGTYVDVPMGACVGTHLEQETREGTPISMSKLGLMLTSLWGHVWGRARGKAHKQGTLISTTKFWLMLTWGHVWGKGLEQGILIRTTKFWLTLTSLWEHVWGHVLEQGARTRHTDYFHGFVAYVGVPMGACVGICPGQRTP